MHLFDAARALLRRQRDRRRRAAARRRPRARRPACRARARVTACFFGEGAVAEGEFHESHEPRRALAAARCCSAARTTSTRWAPRSRARSRRPTSALKAASYGMPAWPVDGMDVLAVEDAARRAALAVRGGGGPALPRAAHLSLPRALDVRPGALPRQGGGRGVEAARPDPALRGALRSRRTRSTTDDAARARAGGRGRDRRARSRSPRRAPRAGRGRWRASCTSRASARDASRGAQARATARRSAQALREALLRDERVFLMGEDVGRYGGCYAVSQRAARGVRPGADPRHAALRVGVRRRGHRRGARRHAPDRRDHDRELQPARARPDREQRGHAARTCRAASSTCRS